LTCLLLPLISVEIAKALAFDESVLLATLTRDQGILSFSTTPKPAISIGRIQNFEDLKKHPTKKEIDVIRRMTGGLALLHHNELSFSLSLPPSVVLQSNEDWSSRMHNVILSAFLELEISNVEQMAEHSKVDYDGHWCFEEITLGDLHLEGHKIVSSSSLRPGGGVFLQGIVHLNQHKSLAHIPGLNQLTSRSIEAPQLQDAIVDQFEKSTGWALDNSARSTQEWDAANVIYEEKYNRKEWNRVAKP
jgi:lipoate-protein ligase A